MSNIILLGGGNESIPIIARVKAFGYRAIVVDGDPNAPGWALADRAAVASCYHIDDALAELRRIGERYDAVLCAATDTPHVAAAFRVNFGLPGMTVEQTALSVDKWKQKTTLQKAGLPVPGFTRLAGVDSSRPNFQCIFKPLDSRGGRGVIRLLPGVDPAWAYAEARRNSATGRVMVEEWLDGPQLSTESIVQNGRVLFTAVGLRNYDRLVEFQPMCIEDGFQSPYQFTQPGPTLADVNALIETACTALDWYQTGGGTVKGDLVIHDGRLFIIELAARLSGGYFATHGHPAAYDVDFVGAAIRQALGERIETPMAQSGAFVCQRYIFPRPDEYDKRIVALPLLPTGGGVLFASWARKAGDMIEPVISHTARLGQVIATGNTPAQARERAQAAAREMREGVGVE